jgi:hypothetical protein
MKKFIKVLSLVLVVVLSVTFLTGCSKCNQKYADKINEKAEQKKWVTYEKVLKDLGDKADDDTMEIGGYRLGAITLIEEKGNIKKVLIVNIADGVAKSASYKEIEIEEK